MKGHTIILIFLPLAQILVQAEKDWSDATPLDIDVSGLVHGRFDTTNSRIVGGHEAVPHSFPHQVALYVDIVGSNRWGFCGGSILSPWWVLTAAHCVDVRNRENVRVVAGAHNLKENEPNQQRVNASQIIIHKRWNSFLLKNDIALIKVSQEIIFNDAVKFLRLPRKSDKNIGSAGSKAIVSGWGKDSDKATAISPILRYMESKIITNFKCKLTFLIQVQSKNICTAGKGRIENCSGDSGGPLTVKENDGEPTQVGIVSFGSRRCESGAPSVYTRITSYLSWISDNTGIPIRD